MMKLMKMMGAALLLTALGACGGGGGSAGATSGAGGSNTTTVPPLAVPAAVEIFSSSPELSSAAGSTVTFTVVVKDASNQAIPNQTVTFKADSGNLQGALPAPKTGPAGEAVTVVSLAPGGDQANRSILVTATAGAVSQTTTIAVRGTVLSLTGDAALLVGGTTTFTAKAVDSAGKAIPNARLTVISTLDNAVAPKEFLTDAAGTARFVYSGTRSGADTLRVSGLGTVAASSVSVSGDDFRFEQPSANVGIPIGSTVTVSVRFLSAGVPVVGRQITFSSTRGSVSLGSAATDVDGRASTVISSATSGPASVIAQSGSAQITLPVVFVATTPAALVLQANPGAIPPNTAGSTLNQSSLQAVVRDAVGNPVQGQVVNFTAVTDGSNGTISPGAGITDANGVVVAQFTPGALTTAVNGVVIRAAVQGSTVSGTAALTVSGQALFIAIAQGNVISNLNVTTYQKEFSVYVTDANGAPAANRVVNLSVTPTTYGKGALAYSTTTNAWEYDPLNVPIVCPNEDVNANGILNPGEDINGDGRLTPGLPVTVSPASVTTGANGFATFFLQYGENFAYWVDTVVTARATVSGTESVQRTPYFLEGLSSDYTNQNVPPAGRVSPFGVNTSSCANPG